MTGDTQLPKFDADNWVKVARFAVAASVVLSAVTVAILLMFDPPQSVSELAPQGRALDSVVVVFRRLDYAHDCYQLFHCRSLELGRTEGG
jgi:hypothetical protein